MSSLSSRERRALLARANRLSARWTIGPGGATPEFIAHLRQVFESEPLIKVRVRGDREEADRVGEALARQVPCEVVRRIGRVLILYRPPDASDGADAGE